jgi:hypothetical protein
MDFKDIDKVKRDMYKFGKALNDLTATRDNVGVHHDAYFKDYLTHSAVLENDNNSKLTYSSYEPGSYRYESKINNTQPVITNKHFSSFVGQPHIQTQLPVKTYTQQPITRAIPSPVQYPTFVRPISGMILTQGQNMPPTQGQPIRIDGRRSSNSPSRPATENRPLQTIQTATRVIQSRSKSRGISSEHRVRFAEPPALAVSPSVPSRLQIIPQPTRTSASPPRQHISQSPRLSPPRPHSRPLPSPATHRQPAGRPQASHVPHTDDARCSRADLQPAVDGRVINRRLADYIVDASVSRVISSPDELVKTIHDKFELEKQSVSEAFDTMLKRVIDQTDEVKHHIFAEIEGVEANVVKLIHEMSQNLQNFIRQADHVQER